MEKTNRCPSFRSGVALMTLVATALCIVAQMATAQPVPEDVLSDIEALQLDEFGIPKGFMVIEGDIIVSEDFYERGETAATFTSRGDFWSNGTIPYVFSTNVTSTNRTRMINAMAEWEAVSSVNFFPRSGQSNYLFIQSSTGNNSFVGEIGGAQTVNIVSWTSRFIIAHELNHAMGYWHEQSRGDRNSFVTVDLSNVSQTACSGNPCDSNFNRRTSAGFLGPYDYDSVMHYGECSFSICGGCPTDASCSNGGQTIFANNGTDVGQRTHLSRCDIDTAALHYTYSNWRVAENSCRCSVPFLNICTPDGTVWCPYDGFRTGLQATPNGGTLWLPRGQVYSAVGVYGDVAAERKDVRVRVPCGHASRLE